MDSTTINTIELCAGVGMLGEGLAAGLRYMGVDSRCILYAEREAYPCSVLEARMSEGSLAPAPIWCGDFRELPASEFRGAVDCIAAGFPCQDLSLAGRRAGLDGARSGLFFDILDIADDCEATGLFLENVAGIASATASVVDEAEGALEERAAARVLGELADRGWNAEWLTLSASEVGASHGRARWFCFAWRNMDNAGRVQRCTGHEQDRPGVAEACGHKESDRATDRSGDVADTQCISGQRWGKPGDVACTGDDFEGETRQRKRCRSTFDGGGFPVANTSSPRPQGSELRTTRDSHRGGQETHGSVSQLCGLFAPGPSDPRWTGIISAEPWFAPAIDKAPESLLRGTPDGLAIGLDFSHRAQRLKCVGNGVVPLQAAVAFITLARRAGFMKKQPLAIVSKAQVAINIEAMEIAA